MNRNDVDWRGYWTAPVTPFAPDGSIEEASLRAVLTHAVDSGVHGILCNGSTGEWFSQSDLERRRVAEIAVDAVGSETPVTVAVTCVRPEDAAALAEHAEAIGASAIMLSPPPMARPTTAELFEYFDRVFSATSLPAWLYNFPQDNGRPMTLSEIEVLAEHPSVVAIKQSAPDTAELLATIERVGSQIRVFGHLVSRLGAFLIHSGFGGDGQVGSGLLLGSDMPQFFEQVWAGDLEAALRIAGRFEGLMRSLRGDDWDGYNWRYGGMHGSLKAAMSLIGQSGGVPRSPKLPVTAPDALDAIAQALRSAGLEVTKGSA